VKISCPSCSAKYSISDEKVVSRLAKIRCRKCSATIVIDGKVNPPTVTATAGSAGDAGEDHAVQEHTDTGGPEYSVDLGEGDQRTMPLSDIIEAYNTGQITGETFVWADGFSDWKALSEVQEIVDALHAAAGGAKPASSPAAASPWDAKPAAAQPSPVRAAARPARAAASDLFGRIDRAGSEEEVATSAPDVGLGGGGGGGGTGARNESSVLFSLSALTSASAPSNKSVPSPSRASSGSSTAASRDDSGLIDLKALTAAAVKADGGAQPALAAPALSPLTASPLGVAAPLGLGSPLGGGLISGDLGAPQKSKTGLFIAIAIVAAAVIVALAVILRPVPPPPVVAAPPPPPPPTAAPAPTPTPTLAAAPPPTGSAEAEAPATKKTSSTTYRRTGTGGVTKKPTGGTTTSGGGSEPAAAPAKPKSKCGCASGDLQCAMRCAAKGG
jgi:predicted Zn finger-like uncharacterized protein